MRPLKNPCEVAVIGGGLAGLTAARHATRLGCLVSLFEGRALFGGQVATINEVDALPIAGKFSGQELAIQLLTELRTAGARVLESAVARIELAERLTLADHDGSTYHPRAIIIASGASLKKLAIDGEEKFLGRGVSQCADCDGAFFRGQPVVVVGGGDSAAQEALILATTSQRVFMVCRSALTARRDYIDKLAARDNVSFIWDSEVSAILGTDAVCGVRLRSVKDGTSSELDCMGVFPFIGTTPNSEFVPASLLTGTRYIQTGPGFATLDARVFAVGAVRAHYGGHVVQAMAEGVAAAQSVARLLFNQGREHRKE